MPPAGSDPEQYSYQDDTSNEDPIKERKVSHTVEFVVTSVATPAEMQLGSAESGKLKGQAVYFQPTSLENLGTYVGHKEASSTFHNDSDQKIVVTGAWCKNWSLDVDTVDTTESFRLEVPAGGKKTTVCKNQWNFPLFQADGETVPARLLMMRYFVHSSDAWSEKYKATSFEVPGGTPSLNEMMKNVTVYRRVDKSTYYTIGGQMDDESPVSLIGWGKFKNFDDVNLIDGKSPTPPMPKTTKMVGRDGLRKETINVFGISKDPYKAPNGTVATYQDVNVNLSTTDKIGLGVYPIDYYDETYGWGGMLVLVTVSRKDVEADAVPTPWLNTYTTPDMTNNSTLEWELPALGSVTMDETNDDMAVVAGRFRFFEEAGAFVLWDYNRAKPALIGSGYGSFSGAYQFYGPKVFTGKKTVIRAVIAPSFTEKTPSPHVITWGGVFLVVSTVIKVLYLVGQALGAYDDRDKAMKPYLDPLSYKMDQELTGSAARSKLCAFQEKQKASAGKWGRKKKLVKT